MESIDCFEAVVDHMESSEVAQISNVSADETTENATMIRAVIKVIGVAAIAVLATIPGARAGILEIPPPTVSGPGGTGTASVDPTDDIVLIVFKDYDAVSYLDVAFSVDAGGVYLLLEEVENNTGVTWIGFRYDIISAPAGSQFFSAFDLSGGFPDVVPNNGPPITSLSFAGGTVSDGSSFLPFIELSIADAGSVVIRQTPLGLRSVPEPSSLALIGISAASLLGVGISRRKIRAWV